MARAYYNEIEPAAAHVLRALIADGVIAPGDVDTRSIKDVQPDDLAGYTQAHFFAGGGLWSVAARLAGWPDDRHLWTGSCPCQPFSAAGKGLGADDPRHLWPDFFRLIRARRPPVIMGEQVAGAPGYGWFDGVRFDLAGEDFAGRTVDIPACAVDAPHIRQRLYWIAVEHASGIGRREGRSEHELRSRRTAVAGSDAQSHMAYGGSARLAFGSIAEDERRDVRLQGAPSLAHDARGSDVADAARERQPERQHEGVEPDIERGTLDDQHGEQSSRIVDGGSGSNGSFWSDAEWLACHDGKARRTKPGLRLLVDGLPGRVGLWRIAGNAIVPELAAEVIRAFMETEGLSHAA